jgi:hypothetical protein
VLPTSPLLTLGQVAQYFGRPTWVLQRLADQKRFPFQRVGRYRVVPTDQLPAVEAALRAAGYLPPVAKGQAPEEVRP